MLGIRKFRLDKESGFSEGKIKGHSAIGALCHCLHIFFWGAAPKVGGAMVLCKTNAICRFYGGAIVHYARKTPQSPTFKQYARI